MSWTIGNFYLTTEQMQGNAREVLSFFRTKRMVAECYCWDMRQHAK